MTQERAQHCCEYCIASAHFNTDSFQFDHIIPRISGGTSDADNIAYSCGNCNLHKQDHTHHVDPLTGNFVRLFHPRQHRWTDHFCWSEDELTILGITDIARATIHLLQMNRPSKMNLRSLLALIGLHPPPFTL